MSTATRDIAAQYIEAGFKLCAIAPGSKGPKYSGWESNPLKLEQVNSQGLGLIHALSRTCAIDFDDLHESSEWLNSKGIDLNRLLSDDEAVQISSGRVNRAKLLYRLPEGIEPLRTRKFSTPSGAMMIEFRCSAGSSSGIQDVLPPTIHPDPDTGKPYAWAGAGDFRALPELPPALLQIWLAMGGPPVAMNAPYVEDIVTASTETIRELRSALTSLRADDRALWVEVGHALKTIGEPGRGLWLEWSQTSDKYDPCDSAHKWASFKPENTGHQAVFAKAQRAGWLNPRSNAAQQGVPAGPPKGYNAYTDPDTGEVSYWDNGGNQWASPLKYEQPLHPLAKFIDYDAKPKAVRWVIPGFIGQGVVIIAGAHGVGKTTALLPLAMVAAGLHGAEDELAPRHWRHVVYIVEDVEQAWRILAGIVQYGGLGIDAALVRERLHIVEALRLDPAYVAQVGKTYREQFTRMVGSVEILPLVVVDTKAAVLALENENDNSEASAAMAALKQGFEGLPVWLIGHIAKQNMNRSNVSELSLRGGSAFEADANQVLYLVKEDEARYLVRGKTRFEAKWQELQIQSQCAQTMAEDEFGEFESVTLRWAVAAPPEQTRKEAKEQAQERSRKDDNAEMRDEVRNAIEEAWQSGFPLNRAGVRAKVGGQGARVVACIENLLSERWIYEVEVPAKERTNSNRKSFLVNFTTAEHEALVRDGEIPTAKLAIPESWKKAAISSVPDLERTDAANEDAS